jgi:hypothetical protein
MEVTLPTSHPTPDELLKATRELILLRRENLTILEEIEKITGILNGFNDRLKKLEVNTSNISVNNQLIETVTTENKTNRKPKKAI